MMCKMFPSQDGFHGFKQATKLGATPLFWPGHSIFISEEDILAPNITISFQKAMDTIELS